MCGIAGFNGNYSRHLLDNMSSIIRHRGPDDDGIFHDPELSVGLAHRRLAIQDLSEAGHQPMTDDAGRAIIVFNGEIYNFPQLREGLSARGIRFRGHSDTEVLLYLYLQHGPDMLGMLNGIFAFAIWDNDRRELFVARDGFGVKPLYYATTAEGFIFASELKALLQATSVPKELNPAAIARHLTFLWSPAPETILKAVRKLEPGTAMIIREGRIARSWRFYRLPFGRVEKVENLPIEEYRRILQKRLDAAVERQMIADVPVGAFLSGGLDSSAIAYYARRHLQDKLQCFTVAYDGADAKKEGMTQDLPFARQVAERLDVDLHVVHVDESIANSLESMIYHLDEPQADPAALNALFICELARDRGIKVLLSGAGGDDIFSGYRRHQALQLAYLWEWLPKSARKAIARLSRRLPVQHPLLRKLRKLLVHVDEASEERLLSHFFWQEPGHVRCMLSTRITGASLQEAEIVAPLMQTLRELPDNASRLDQMLELECRYFLGDHNLSYTDRMSMAHGVEVRVPLLDPELVDFAASIPDGLKIRKGVPKWIFKKSMEGLLPNDVIYRPKTGFGVPLRQWLGGKLRFMVDDLLGRDAIRKRGIFDVNAVTQMIEDDRKGKVDAAYTIFALLCLEIWCQTFIDA